MTVENSIINVGVLPPALSGCEHVCVQRFTDFLGLSEIGLCTRVCKLWNEACKNQEIWIGVTIREGIPFVEGQGRDRRADLQVLYPMTISGKRSGGFLGKMIGQIPFISEVFLNVLNAPDPFEEDKLIKDTFVFIVDFPQIERTVDEETPLDLDEQGNLIELDADQVQKQTGKVLLIPNMPKNLRVLCSHPLKGKENMPVFSKYSSDEVFNQCSVSSNKVSVYFMRRCVADETRDMDYPGEEKFVNKRGFDVTPFRVRALFDAVEILESGTCPDSGKPRYTYARCSDIVRFGTDEYHAGIGGFAPRSGADVSIDDGDDVDISVAPGVSAEVLRPLALEPLGLGEGH
jgi:hypothetical protein